MSLDAGASKLKRSMKTLQEHWAETKSRWQDQASRKFEEDQLASLKNEVNATLSAIDRLASILDTAKRECG